MRVAINQYRTDPSPLPRGSLDGDVVTDGESHLHHSQEEEHQYRQDQGEFHQRLAPTRAKAEDSPHWTGSIRLICVSANNGPEPPSPTNPGSGVIQLY